jgi:molybdopterin converting factor small subunit
MRVLVNLFGPEVKVRQEVSLAPASASLADVLASLRQDFPTSVGRFLAVDLSPIEGAAILLNGRNIGPMDRHSTSVRDCDELTFTVMVAGG